MNTPPNLLYAALPILLSLAAPIASAQSSESEPSHAIAKSIANLARWDHEVDLFALARELRLPNLEQQMTWRGPIARYQPPQFFAFYDPPKSELGIKKVVVEWSMGKLMLSNKLRLVLEPRSCPTQETLEIEIGSKASKITISGIDGGPASVLTSFTIPQPHGEPVHVTYPAEDTCHIEISHSREW